MVWARQVLLDEDQKDLLRMLGVKYLADAEEVRFATVIDALGRF